MKPGEIAHNISRGAFYLTVEKATAALSGIAYVALLMRWMGPTKYGIISIALAAAGLATLATGNFEMFLERYVAEFVARGDRHALRRSFALTLGLKLGLGFLAGLVLVALAPFIADQYKTPELRVLLPVLAIMVAADGLSTAGRATLYGLQRFRAMSLVAVVFHVAKTVMVGLLWYTQHGLVSLAVGLTVLTVAQGLASTLLPLWALRPTPGEPPDERRTPLFKSMMSYCLPLLGARVTFTSGQNLSKIVLGKLFDAAQLGFFAFAFQTVERLVELVYTLPSALLPSLTHLVARGERERLADVFNQAHRLIQVAGCAVALGLFVFAREITLLVGSPLFEPAIPLLRVLALVPAARTAQQPLTMLFQAMRRPGTVLGLALSKFVAEFGSYFLLVPALATAGAAWANLIGAVISYVAALVVLVRLMPERAGERTRSALVSAALLVPLLAIALGAERLPFAFGLGVRVLLIPLAVVAAGATGLVVRYDLEKLEALPLTNELLRRMRTRTLSFARVVVRRPA